MEYNIHTCRNIYKYRYIYTDRHTHTHYTEKARNEHNTRTHGRTDTHTRTQRHHHSRRPSLRSGLYPTPTPTSSVFDISVCPRTPQRPATRKPSRPLATSRSQIHTHVRTHIHNHTNRACARVFHSNPSSPSFFAVCWSVPCRAVRLCARVCVCCCCFSRAKPPVCPPRVCVRVWVACLCACDFIQIICLRVLRLCPLAAPPPIPYLTSH